MRRAQFRVELPADTWVADVSRAFPEATFRMLSGVRDSDGAVELGEVLADDPEAAADALAAHDDVVWCTELDREDGRVLVRYRTTDTALHDFVSESGMPPEYPVVAEDGWFDFDVTAPREELDRFRTILEEGPLAYELQSLVGTTDTDGLVTDRQREVLAAALHEGYFEVPREASLAEVAGTLDVDKSTVSGVLRRGEARILKAYLTGPGETGRP